MKIYLRLKPGDDQWIRPLNTSEYRSMVFPKIGHKIVQDAKDADVVVQEHYLQDVIHENTIIFQRLDALELLEGVVDRFDRNEWVKGYLLPGWCPDSITSKVQGPSANTSKPVWAINTMPWAQFGALRVKVKPEYEKPYDLSFAGCLSYGKGGVPDPTFFTMQHRANLLANWVKVANHRTFVAGLGVPRPFSVAQHFNYVSQSKVIVSPWGYCELSWRDWEAVFGQAVVIKPRGFTEIRTTLWPWHHAVPCEPDFSDIDKAFQAAMTMFEHSKQERRELAEHFAEKCQNKRELAREFVKAIEKVLG